MEIGVASDWPSSIGVLGILAAGLLGTACQPPVDEPAGVQSVLTGRITVRASVDTTDDYGGFRVLVADAQGRTVDTLGHAVTDRNGRFRTTVTAPARGVYPLMIWGRDGERRLETTDLVVASGDTARLEATLPLGLRRLQVRSPENSAWAGYRTIQAQHRRTLLRRLKERGAGATAAAQGIRQTSSMLWGLRDTYPDTYAAQIAAVESLSLLEGWNDSLVVARAQSIRATNPRYVEAAQIARRAVARWRGQAAALALLDTLEARAETREQQAGVQAIRVRTFIDSLQKNDALTAARALRVQYPNTEWGRWADRARYEIQHLFPGTTAPEFTVRTLRGDSVSLRSIRGRPLVLEFYRPQAGLYARQVPTRNALHRVTRPDSVAFVSVSTDPDTVVNRAFLSNRSLPGHQVIASRGEDTPIVEAYNVVRTPTRFLIDAEGRIVGRYEGAAFLALQDDLLRLTNVDSTAAPTP